MTPEKYLYYAFTNTQLINLVNIRVNIYSEYPSDLYIVDNGRISEKLVENIKNQRLFEKVCIIKHAPFSSFTKKYHYLPKYLRKLLTLSFIIFNYIRYNFYFIINSKLIHNHLLQISNSYLHILTTNTKYIYNISYNEYVFNTF